MTPGDAAGPVAEPRGGRSPEARDRLLAALLGLAALAMGAALWGGVGVSWDEPRHQVAGELHLRYLASLGADRAILDFHNFYLYGGFFDAATALVARWLPQLPAQAPRHAASLALGALAVMYAARLGCRAGGRTAGLLAGLLLLATPRWIGHSLFNPKDVPFAAFYVVAVEGIVAVASRRGRGGAGAWLQVTLATAAATGVRIAGLILPFYLLLALVTRRSGPGAAPAGARRDPRLPAAAASIAVALLLAWPFWPLLHSHPLEGLLEVTVASGAFPFFDPILFAGRLRQVGEIGRSYLPVWLAIALPLSTLAGLAVAAWPQRRAPGAQGDRPSLVGARGVVAVAALLPPAMVVALGSPLYDGLRHLLFVVPPLTVLAACGWSDLLSRWKARPALRRLALVALALTVAEPLLWTARSGALCYTYFNPLAGGLAGASHRFETDYWGLSLRRAAELLDRDRAAGGRRGPLRVRTNAPWQCVEPFLADPARIRRTALDDPAPADLELLFDRFLPPGRLLDPGPGVVHAERIVAGQVPFFVLRRLPETGR